MTFTPFLDRPSMGQLAAMAAGPNGWACPRCGCCDWRVASSYLRADGIRRRQRVCRNCGHAMPTYESPIQPQPEPAIGPEANGQKSEVREAPPVADPADDGLPAGLVLEPDPPAIETPPAAVSRDKPRRKRKPKES